MDYLIRNKIKVKNMGIERLEVHQPDYKTNSWEEYSFEELGNVVGFFSKRAGHRATVEKVSNDLYDAKNYLVMMEEKLRRTCESLGIVFEEL